MNKQDNQELLELIEEFKDSEIIIFHSDTRGINIATKENGSNIYLAVKLLSYSANEKTLKDVLANAIEINKASYNTGEGYIKKFKLYGIDNDE